jgi:hypothetical protein
MVTERDMASAAGRARSGRLSAVLAVTVGMLLTTMSGGAVVAAPAGPRDGVAAVIASYQARIPTLMDRKHIPGLALALVDGDGVVWQQGFGRTDSDGRGPVTVDTIFSVQSMSKVFTATAVMQAVQSGRLDLDVPITTYLPGFTVCSAFEPDPERRITLRMLLALLIAFNTTTIGVDERAREHATMLAFGLPPRTVLGMTTVETVLIGVFGTAVGIAGGYGLLRWMTATTIPSVLPEIGVTPTLSTPTVVQALALGVLTVAIAPLFTMRRTRRMDIPSTLRVME